MKLTREDFQQRLLPILCSQAFGFLCGLAGIRLTSALVAPDDYGWFGVFTSLTPLGAGVVWIGLVKYVGRHWDESTDKAGLLRAVLAAGLRKLPWLAAAVAALTLLAVRDDRLLFGALLFVAATLLACGQLGQTALQAMRAHWRDCGIAAGNSLLRSFAPPLLYVVTAAGLPALLGGFTLHAIVAAGLAALALRPWWRQRPAGPLPLSPVYEGTGFMMLAVAGWMAAGANRWLVLLSSDPETAGYFTLAGNIGIILPAMAGLVIQQYLQPEWFAHPATDRAGLLRRIDLTAAAYTLIALGLSAGLHGAMPWLIGPLISARYAPAAEFVLATGAYATALTLSNFYHVLLLATRREARSIAVDLTGAAVLLGGGVLATLGGAEIFKAWLLLTPAVPWLVNRPLARAALRRTG